MEVHDALPGTFRPKMPFHMVWLATNACNARCRHCSSNSTTRSPDELTTEEAFGLIDELAEAGVVDLAVSGGEPLLRKDLFQIIEHARRRGMSVGVGSNGGRVTPSQLRQLKEAGINRFQVSLDGLPNQHDWLRRWPGLFTRVQLTLALAHDAGLPTHVCCTINRNNAATLEGFADLVAAAGVKRLNLSRYVPTGRGTDALDLSDDAWKSIARRCIDIRERHRGRLEVVTHLAQQILVDPEVQDMPAFIGCQAGIGQGCVTATGDVLPCVLLPIPMGNVRQRRFAEIWRDSPVTKALRARALEGACGTCKLTDRCAGCRAVAFAKTGNYLATDPRCWVTTIRLPDKRRKEKA
jgi:AdoMet-dependent heme synthase